MRINYPVMNCSLDFNLTVVQLELQFGFQPYCSTTMCSWVVSSVIDYYNQAGRPVYACAMDLSKALDLVAWGKLFPELLEKNISVLSLRCIIHIYIRTKLAM